ncbi:MAG: pyruvate carboxylase subunit B [Thermodesulfobacteriota bacterium]
MKKLNISDSSLTDGFQYLYSAMGRTADMVLAARLIDEIGFYSAEVSKGIFFDIMHRSLNEDPWERIRQLSRCLRKTPMSIMLMGRNLAGNYPCPEDVISAFIERTAANGISIVKLFDPLNDIDNLPFVAEKTKAEGMHFQGGIFFGLTSEKGLKNEKIYTIDYFCSKAEKLVKMGAESICIKDSSGIITPFESYELINALKSKVSVPVHFHTHSTGGIGFGSLLKAVEAGADGIDSCLSPFAGRNSLPASDALVKTFEKGGYKTGIDPGKIEETVKYTEDQIIPKYRFYLDEDRVSLIDSDLISKGIPGYILKNIYSQLKENNKENKFQDVVAKFVHVRTDLGSLPLIGHVPGTVAVQAVNNVLFDEYEGEYKFLSDQVVKLVKGYYGKTPAPVAESLKKKVQELYPDSSHEKNEVLKLGEAGRNIKGLAADVEDELIYALFPKTGKRFLKWKYLKEDPPAETHPMSLKNAKARLNNLKKLKEGKPSEEGLSDIPQKGPKTRTFNVYVEDEFFEVAVDPGSEPFLTASSANAEEKKASGKEKKTEINTNEHVSTKSKIIDVSEKKNKSEPDNSDFFFLKSPMPGSVVSLRKKSGDTVKKGEIILVLEAMKMENPLSSPADGVIKEIRCTGGDQVPKDFVLCVIDSGKT